MVLDNFVESDILCTCNALGSEINGVYEKGIDCIECLKDILRYLRRDDDSHSVLRYLGSIRLLQTDLIPLIKRYDKDGEIFDYTLRILIILTNPVLQLYKDDIPDDKISRNVYLQIVSNLVKYKESLSEVSFWNVLQGHLKNLLKIKPVERSNNENLLIERIIILVRNVLHVPTDESIFKRTDDDLSPHDKVLWSLHLSKIDVLILYLAANEEEHQYCLHVLEITSLMLREHSADVLAATSKERTDVEKEKDINTLLSIRQREQNLRQLKLKSVYMPRFNGVYCIKNMKSLSDKDYIAHKLIPNLDEVKFDSQKDSKRVPKNKFRAQETETTRQSTLNVRLFLKHYCIEFLKTYNKIMMYVKRELQRKISNDHDDTFFLWAVGYFLQFNHLYDFQPAFVSETISLQAFHHIQTEITNYQEMMLTDKKKMPFWCKRIQLGVSAYKELLESLKKMENSSDEIIKRSADALIGQVFYVIEYRELLLSLLTNYDEVKFPLSYLAKLVESVQLFLKMLENYSKRHSKVIVQKKQKKIRRRKKKKDLFMEHDKEKCLNDQWDLISNELQKAIESGQTIQEVTPFDAASALSFEEQKVEAVYKICEAIGTNEPLKAIGLLRAARELWPEGNSFGASDIGGESELCVLKEIHFSGLQRDLLEKNEMINDSGSDDEECDELPALEEKQLDLSDVYKRYASPKVIKPCSILLANYQNNKPQTNACLIKLLYKIAWNCKMYALFFQSTIFITFQKIFHDPDVNINPIVKELFRFAKYIVCEFFEAAKKNNKVFVEFLFWKGAREAYELDEGYAASEKKPNNWTEDEEEELRYLFEENKNICIEGQDVADLILANFNPRNKTKAQIISALKRLDLIKSVQDLKPEKRKEWLDTELLELQHLYEDYKDTDDVMGIILDKLSIKRSRKAVVEKLLTLNLIQDRKEVRKKYIKKGNDKNSSTDSSDDDEFRGNSNSEIHKKNKFDSESSDNEAEMAFFKNLEAENLDAADCPNSENNYTEIGSTSVAKIAEVWEEQEIFELTELFNKHNNSFNIVKDIMNGLSVKRSKHSVIEKILELNLIKNKEELKKKKKINKTAPNGVKKKKPAIVSDSSDEDILNKHDSVDSSVAKKIKNKRSPKVWSEQEIIELQSLFEKYQNSSDIMNSILTNLTVKRSKQNVIEKLIELNCVKDKKELRKKRQTKNAATNRGTQALNSREKHMSGPWNECEIFQLHKLFQDHKNSDDVMKEILNDLSVKRTKKDVIQKMVEIGLVSNKKEIMCKKAESNVLTHKVKRYKRQKKVTPDTSDDDLPLSHISKVQKLVLNGSFISDENSSSSRTPAETFNTVDENSDTEEVGIPLKLPKRKRLQIDSDDSEHELVSPSVETPVKPSDDVLPAEESSSQKFQKKRVRILYDSDDSN